MTNIHILKDDKNLIRQFTISGHAEFSEYGSDIVCAAISILSQGVILGIEEIVKEKVNYKINEDQGELFCSIPLEIKNENMNLIQVLLKTMVLNLKQLGRQYPNHVFVVEEEV